MRAAFDRLGEQYIELSRSLADDQLDLPGLGLWNVRELLGHAIRAFSTASANLDASPVVEYAIDTAREYYRAAFSSATVHAEIAERGVQAGLELRDDLVGTVEAVVTAACARVGAAGDDDVVNHFVGQIPFVPYMATRVVEAGVHLLDLQRALGRKVGLDPNIADIVLLTLAETGDAIEIILGLTGRTDIPPGFNVLR